MNRIKELRTLAGLTLEQVAEKADTNFQTVQRLEVGKMKLTEAWMRRLAPALGVQPHELMARTISVPSKEESPGQRLEPLVVSLWRRLDAAGDIRGMEMVLRAMAPPGFKLPPFDQPTTGPRRKRN